MRDVNARLAAMLCVRGRLCRCEHGGGEYACPWCGCDCPLVGPDETDDDPDACTCCYRTPE